jgi:hypothetical protein
VTLAAEPLAVEYDPTVAEMIDQVQQTTLHTYDGNLSGEWPVYIGGSQQYTITTRYTVYHHHALHEIRHTNPKCYAIRVRAHAGLGTDGELPRLEAQRYHQPQCDRRADRHDAVR